MGKQTAELLAVAKVWLTDGPGWGKGLTINNQTGQLCAYGAIAAASNDGEWDPTISFEPSYETSQMSRDAVNALEVVAPNHPASFNDHPKTKLPDVLALFDKAIKSTLVDATCP